MFFYASLVRTLVAMDPERHFEEVEEAYWFGPVRSFVRPSVHLSVMLLHGQEPLEIGY